MEDIIIYKTIDNKFHYSYEEAAKYVKEKLLKEIFNKFFPNDSNMYNRISFQEVFPDILKSYELANKIRKVRVLPMEE